MVGAQKRLPSPREAFVFGLLSANEIMRLNEHGWSPVPNEQSLRRRFKDEVPQSVVTMARKGKDAAKGLYPAQRRDRSGLHAMEAVNMDGHRFDVFVIMPGKTTAAARAFDCSAGSVF